MALPIPFGGGGMLVAQVLGVSETTGALLTFGRVLARMALSSDAKMAQEMVDRMRGDVPQDTGTLYNGITWRHEGGEYVVEASAVHPHKGGADYAGFVERGTRAGQRGGRAAYVADSAYFDLSAEISDGAVRTPAGRRYSRSRRQYRTHPGTPAQPYFFANAQAVLRKRAIIHRANIALAAAEVGYSAYQITSSVRALAAISGGPAQIGHF